MGIVGALLQYRSSYPSTQASISEARKTVVAFAQAVGFRGTQLHELELAAGEALANAVEHGHTNGGSIVVEAAFDSAAITLDIADSGKGFSDWERSEPAPRKADTTRGFGMRIMHATMDEVRYLEGGRRVRLTKRLAVARADSSRQER